MKKWILLVIYAIDVFFCLRAIKQKNSHEYALTKPFLMPLLCGLYFAFLPEVLRSAPHQKFVLYALMFHTLGDVLLLFPRTKTKAFFYAGMASFFVGHVGYCLWFITAPVGHSHKLAFFLNDRLKNPLCILRLKFLKAAQVTFPVGKRGEEI